MATSGSKSVTVTSWDKLVFNWSLSSQSIASNTSTVTWSMKLVATSSGRIDSSTSKDWKVTVNGTVYTGTNTVGISNNSTKTLASGTTVISHNADGTKDFTFTFQQEFNITFSGSSIGTIGGNGSGSLPTIARASQPSCVTWPEHTQNVGEFGDEISIHMNRASSAFTHTVRYQFGSQSGTIATNVGTGTKWVIPLSLMELIPNNTKGSGTIYVDTYNGSTKIGTKYCGFTATVPASVKPSCALTITDPTGNADTYGAYVKGISKMSVKVTPTLAYTSPIKTYSTTANGSKYTSASFTTGVIKSSGTLTTSATITDGRGRTATASKSITVLNYSAPSITKLVVGRCDEDGTNNMQGEYVAVTFSASATALNNKNNVTYTIRYKKSSETSFTEVGISVTDKYAVTNQQYIFEADTGHSYDVELVVVDNHSTATRSTSASTAFTLMHFGADGTSIGLLKVAEKENAVDVGGDVYLNGHALYGAHGLSDTRDTNETPQWYMETHGRGVVWEFKTMTSIQFTAPSAEFAPVQTIIPWQDASGGLPRQIAYEGNKRWIRIATSETSWGAWRTDTSNASGVTLYSVDPTTTSGIYCNGKTAADSVNSRTLSDPTKKYKRLKIFARFPYALHTQEFELATTAQGNDATFGNRLGGILIPAGDNSSGANKHYLYKLNFCVRETSAGWTFQVTDSGWVNMGIATASASQYASTSVAINGTAYQAYNQRHNADYCVYKIVGYEE